MNSFRTSERLSGLLAVLFSGLIYITAALVFFLAQKDSDEQWPSMGPKTVNLSFAQIELQTAAASPAEPVPPPLDRADTALKEIQKAPEPEAAQPEEAEIAPEPGETQTAQVTQEASASGAQIESAEPLTGSAQTGEIDWRMLAAAKVRAMVEREKYYPPAARNAGLEGRFSLLVKIAADGKISTAEITGGRGHILLRNALGKILAALPGRDIGQTLPEPVELPFEFEFKLE